MKKKPVKCIKKYIQVNGNYNFPIYIPINGGWAHNVLVSCSSCGEILVIDNPAFLDLDEGKLKKAMLEQECPKCAKYLADTLLKYPDSFFISKGEIGTFHVPDYLGDTEKMVTMDFGIIELNSSL